MKEATEKPGKATFFQAMKAVSWAFFGIRKKGDHLHDAASLTLKQVVIAGLIGGALFVTSVLLLVKIVTS